MKISNLVHIFLVQLISSNFECGQISATRSDAADDDYDTIDTNMDDNIGENNDDDASDRTTYEERTLSDEDDGLLPVTIRDEQRLGKHRKV